MEVTASSSAWRAHQRVCNADIDEDDDDDIPDIWRPRDCSRCAADRATTNNVHVLGDPWRERFGPLWNNCHTYHILVNHICENCEGDMTVSGVTVAEV